MDRQNSMSTTDIPEKKDERFSVLSFNQVFTQGGKNQISELKKKLVWVSGPKVERSYERHRLHPRLW